VTLILLVTGLLALAMAVVVLAFEPQSTWLAVMLGTVGGFNLGMAAILRTQWE
jgi:hypothetical protein